MAMPPSLPSQPPALTPPATSTRPQTKKLEPYDLENFIYPREDLVDELIARVHDYHIIRVIGPPASGKTTLMKLMVNKLLEMHGPTKPIHVLTGWDKQEVCGAPGWARYLEHKTGFDGQDWLANPAYLILDEAQQTYWDSELWASFFKSAGPGYSVFIVLFMSYGSPGEGLEGFEMELYSSVPMHFGHDQENFLRPERSISDLYLAQKPVGLLLDENEAMHVVTRYASTAVQPSPSLTADMKKGLFLTSSGHVGLLTSLTHVLHDVPELYDLVQRGISIDWQTTSKILSSQPLKFFDLLSGYPFAKGLPTLNSLRDPITAQVFKTAIAHDGIYKASLRTGSKEFKYALRDIWRNGWLHAVESNWDIRYIFASQIHRWFCQCLLAKISSEPDIAIPLPLVAVDATEHLQLRQPTDMQGPQ